MVDLDSHSNTGNINCNIFYVQTKALEEKIRQIRRLCEKARFRMKAGFFTSSYFFNPLLVPSCMPHKVRLVAISRFRKGKTRYYDQVAIEQEASDRR
jgi:hypothetical protein